MGAQLLTRWCIGAGLGMCILMPCIHAQQRPSELANAWSKGDHEIASVVLETLTSYITDLDDCTYKGAFNNPNAVPDSCNGRYVAASGIVFSHSDQNLRMFFKRSCSKWRGLTLVAE